MDPDQKKKVKVKFSSLKRVWIEIGVVSVSVLDTAPSAMYLRNGFHFWKHLRLWTAVLNAGMIHEAC